MTVTATCALEDRLDGLSVATRTVIAALDVSGGNNLCEESQALSAVVGLATMMTKQVLRVVGWGAAVSVGNTTGARKMNIKDPYVALRRVCVTLGDVISGWLLKATKIIAPSTAAELAPAYDKIGALLSRLMAITISESCIPTRCWMAPEIPQAM